MIKPSQICVHFIYQTINFTNNTFEGGLFSNQYYPTGGRASIFEVGNIEPIIAFNFFACNHFLSILKKAFWIIQHRHRHCLESISHRLTTCCWRRKELGSYKQREDTTNKEKDMDRNCNELTTTYLDHLIAKKLILPIWLLVT